MINAWAQRGRSMNVPPHGGAGCAAERLLKSPPGCAPAPPPPKCPPPAAPAPLASSTRLQAGREGHAQGVFWTPAGAPEALGPRAAGGLAHPLTRTFALELLQPPRKRAPPTPAAPRRPPTLETQWPHLLLHHQHLPPLVQNKGAHAHLQGVGQAAARCAAEGCSGAA